jgi:TonB family protein
MIVSWRIIVRRSVKFRRFIQLLVLRLNELNDGCRFSKQRLFDLAGRWRGISSMRLYKGTVQFVLCIGVALTASPLARAQGLAPATLQELSKRTEATPTPNLDKPRSKGSIEISAATPNEKPAPLVEQTPPPEELAPPTATAEKKEPRVRKRAIVRPKAPEPPPATPTSLPAAKAMAVSAPLPDYPYEARRAHATGNGVCLITVDTASGNVTSATMTKSTRNALLDKITTDTFGRWRFKPGTVSQVQVPITYR